MTFSQNSVRRVLLVSPYVINVRNSLVKILAMSDLLHCLYCKFQNWGQHAVIVNFKTGGQQAVIVNSKTGGQHAAIVKHAAKDSSQTVNHHHL